jgi:hypothetical protein
LVIKPGLPPLPSGTKPPARDTPVSTAIDLSAIYFKSSDHKRYNGGVLGAGDYRGCMRAIEVKADPDYERSYIVTLYNLSGIHPQWGDNIQIAPKRMRVVSASPTEVTLRGYGDDPMLAGRPPQIQKDYGITIHSQNGGIEYISYHYHDRDVRIDFLK